MTLDQFLAALRLSTDTKWEVRHRYRRIIRTQGECSCPIVHVANRDRPADSKFSNEGWMAAARHIGMHEDLAGDIVNAADTNEGYNKQLRAQLITALNLKDLPDDDA